MTPVTGITCKNCGSTAVVKFGKYKNTQQYYYKDCKRKFKNDSCEFHKKVPTNYVMLALEMHDAGNSINTIRNFLKLMHGYYPSKSTVWNWITKRE